MTPEGFVTLARIGPTRGRIGEVRAECLCAGPDRLQGQSVTLFGASEPRETVVEHAWLHDGNLILKFVGIDSISDAEKLRGCDVAVPRETRPALPDGEFYLSDLVGCALIDRRTGRTVGTVEGWQETPGGVLLEAGTMLVPFARAICTEIDVAGRRIVADLPEGLEDLNSP